jgi:DNA polymerase III epsilon subunit-like protein
MDVKLTVGDIDLKALEINHFTLKRIADGVEPARFLHLLKDDLMTAGFAERVVPCGHCVNFDLDFLSVLCDRMHDNLFMYISRSAMLDTCALARWLTHAGKLKVPDHKLDTICKHLDIPLKPHDAGEDVLAVREVYHKFKALL